MANMGITRDQFFDSPAAQVAVATCHARRLGLIYSDDGQDVQWRDVRRGWKFPEWVSAKFRTAKVAEQSRQNYTETLATVGPYPSFQVQRACVVDLSLPAPADLVAAMMAA